MVRVRTSRTQYGWYLRVRTSSRGGNTEGDRVETTERVRRHCEGCGESIRRQYGQRGHSTDVLFKYGLSTDVRGVQVDLKCDSFDCGNSFAFCIQTEHSESLPRKKMWQTQDERKLLLIHAAVSAMATGGCSYAPSVASRTGSFLGDCCPPFFRLCSATRLANPAAWPTLSYTHCFAAARCFMLQDLRYQVPLTLDPRHEVLGGVAQLYGILLQRSVLLHCILVCLTPEVVEPLTVLVPVNHVVLLFSSEEHRTWLGLPWLRCLRYSIVVLRAFCFDSVNSGCCTFFLLPMRPLLRLLLLQAAHCPGNVHIERFTVFLGRTVDFRRRKCQWRRHSCILRNFRLSDAWRKFCDLEEQQRRNDARRSSDPYSLRTAYCLRTYYRTVYVLYTYCLRTVSVPSPYAESAEIRTLILSAERVRTPWTEYGCRRRHHGERESTEPVRTNFIRSIRSMRQTRNHFQHWATECTDRGG